MKLIPRLLCSCVLLPVFLWAQADSNAWKTVSFVMVSPTSLEEASVERVRVWVETNFHYKVRSVRLEKWEGESTVDQAITLAPNMTTNDLVMVVLTDRMAGEKHAEIMKDVPVGFINLSALKTDDKEKFHRRLERQAVRIVGFQMGLTPTPMPFCALAPYQSLEELDRMGRGISPPARAGYRAVLEKNKLPLSPAADRLLPAAITPKFPVPPTLPKPNVPAPTKDN